MNHVLFALSGYGSYGAFKYWPSFFVCSQIISKKGARKGNLNEKKKSKTPQSLPASSKGIAALLTTQTTAKRRGRPQNSQQNTAVAGPSRMSQRATLTNIETGESTGPVVRKPVLPHPQDNTLMDIVEHDTESDFEFDYDEESRTEDGDGIQNNTKQQQSVSASRTMCNTSKQQMRSTRKQ